MLRFLASTATSYFSPSPAQSKELVVAATYNCSYPFSSSRAPQASIPIPEEADAKKYETIHAILAEDNLYAVLGLNSQSADDENTLRRAYLSKSRQCHPDKFPEYPDSTLAFQKVSFAYSILSDPSSRTAYDLNPTANPESFTHENANDTFDGLLQLLFIDFMSGDFEMVRILLRTMQEVNPALRMEEDSVESIIAGFRKLREVVLGTRTYVRVLRRELLHMHDIQYSMRQLPYLAISSRLRLSLKFTRVFLSLPMAIDRAIEAEEAEKQRRRAAHAQLGEPSANAQVGKRSNILGPKIGGLVNFLVFALEKSESVL